MRRNIGRGIRNATVDGSNPPVGSSLTLGNRAIARFPRASFCRVRARRRGEAGINGRAVRGGIFATFLPWERNPRQPDNGPKRGKGSGPNAGQISVVRTSGKYVRPPFPSACGAKHGARGERRHGDFAGRSFALKKTSLSSVCPTFSTCEGSSRKLPIQNRSVSPFLRFLRVWRRRPLSQGIALI